jgi:hypothetical protein
MTTPTGKQKPVPPPADAIFISARQLLARYGGRSAMWLHRKLRDDPDFPRPIYFGRLQFYRLADLEQFERDVVARAKPAAGRGKIEAA